MKRILLTVFTLFVVFANYAQIPLGFKAGINSNKIASRNVPFDYSYSLKSAISFHVGVFTKLKLSNKLNFIPELRFIQKCGKPNSPNSNFTMKLSYIEFPLLISYQPLAWLSIEAGPSVGFNIGDNTNNDSYNLTDAGGIGGFRFNLTPKWSIITHYYYGMSPIGKFYFNSGPNSVLPAEEVKIYNQNIQLSVAYYLK